MRRSKNRAEIAGRLAWACILSCAAFAGPAHSQQGSFPEPGRPVTWVVPSAAGGSVDTSARVLSEVLSEELGIPMRVINKPGASSQIGLADMARSAPDGYTLGVLGVGVAITGYVSTSRQSSVSRKDFEPIAMVNKELQMLIVPANSRYRSLPELVADARAQPAAIRVAAAPGTGTLIAVQLEDMQKVGFTIVPFHAAARSPWPG